TCKLLDQLSEVNTVFSRIIKSYLAVIPLEFNIGNFHIQTQMLGDLTRLHFSLFLSGSGVLPGFHVFLIGETVNFQGTFFRKIFLLHLHLNQLSGKAYNTYILSRTRSYCSDASNVKRQTVYDLIITYIVIFHYELNILT